MIDSSIRDFPILESQDLWSKHGGRRLVDDEIGFESVLRQLEQTVEELETGDLNLDEALARKLAYAIERGVPARYE